MWRSPFDDIPRISVADPYGPAVAPINIEGYAPDEVMDEFRKVRVRGLLRMLDPRVRVEIRHMSGEEWMGDFEYEVSIAVPHRDTGQLVRIGRRSSTSSRRPLSVHIHKVLELELRYLLEHELAESLGSVYGFHDPHEKDPR